MFATWNFDIWFTFVCDIDGCFLPVGSFGSCILVGLVVSGKVG